VSLLESSYNLDYDLLFFEIKEIQGDGEDRWIKVRLKNSGAPKVARIASILSGITGNRRISPTNSRYVLS